MIVRHNKTVSRDHPAANHTNRCGVHLRSTETGPDPSGVTYQPLANPLIVVGSENKAPLRVFLGVESLRLSHDVGKGLRLDRHANGLGGFFVINHDERHGLIQGSWLGTGGELSVAGCRAMSRLTGEPRDLHPEVWIVWWEDHGSPAMGGPSGPRPPEG